MIDHTRPIIGIENRTAQEVFDIMCDRLRTALATAEAERDEALEKVRRKPKMRPSESRNRVTLHHLNDGCNIPSISVGGAPIGLWDWRKERPCWRFKIHGGKWSDWMSRRAMVECVRALGSSPKTANQKETPNAK